MKSPIRIVALCCALLAAATARTSAAQAPVGATAPRPARLSAFSLRANHIAFYSSRYAVAADDSVVVRLGDGTRITGNTFYMDLRLNRFVVAGDVSLQRGNVTVQGAAFSEYLDFDRAYFLPLGAEPDRWTFAEGNYANPLRGREMPGDAFYLPDFSRERVFLSAKKAVIDPHASVHFWPAVINFGIAFVPFPGYFLEFSSNPNFAQNALAGASIDGPYDFLGGSHALSTLHLRYTPGDNVYFAVEQHQVSDNHYIVASINPVTRPLKQYNLLTYWHAAPDLEIAPALQEIAFQHGFSQPLSATATVNPVVNVGLRRSGLQLNSTFFYFSLLAQPAPGVDGLLYYGDPSHPWVPEHPVNFAATWTGYQNQVNHLPLFFRLRSGFGFAYNSLEPLNYLGGVYYTGIYTKTLGGTLLSPSVRIGRDHRGAQFDLQFNAVLDQQEQWSSLPHRIDTTTWTFSLSKALTPRLQALAQYQNINVADHYNTSADQTDTYPSYAGVGLNGTLYPGYEAFRGFGTTRSLTEQLLLTPSPGISFSASMRENDDFPQAIPQSVGNLQVGVPPYQANFDVRFRVNQILSLDISRSYFFNWGGYYRWGSPYGIPSFNIQVVK